MRNGNASPATVVKKRASATQLSVCPLARASLLIVSLLLAVLSGAGCGKKGPVQALRLALPAAVSGVELAQKGNALLLSWLIPTANQDGSPLTDLAGFKVYKTDYDLAKGCPECRPPQQLLRDIDLDYYRSSHRQSQRILLWDNVVEEDNGYRYLIIPYTASGQFGPGFTIHRPCYAPPLPPAEIAGSGLDQQVRLQWSAAEDSRQGIEWLGYNIYRRSADQYFEAQPLNDAPVAALNYDDFNVSNEGDYSYALRSVVRLGEQVLESQLSPQVAVQPRRP